MTTSLFSIVLVLIAGLIGSVASVFLKAGANRLHRDVEQLKKAAVRLSIGVFLFVTSSVFYIWAIRDGNLTVLYPMLALGYVWTLIWSRLLFGEPFNKTKIYGVALVLLGVVFIGLGNRPL